MQQLHMQWQLRIVRRAMTATGSHNQMAMLGALKYGASALDSTGESYWC